MNNKNLNNWIMYHELHRLYRLGFSNTKIANFLVMDARTVGKYLTMNEQEYEHHLVRISERKKILSGYETFVVNKLTEFQDTPAAQIHDWLKECHSDFPEVSPRTVFNFVMYVRQKHNIPFVPAVREYFPIEELPYGDQTQVDFGDYNMRTSSGKRQKVKFFAMVMSRSRMKFVWFLNKPFTAQTVSQAHEHSFNFFGGIPKTIVYDQDRTMVVDENLGDIILTHAFKQYTKSRSFNLHFCRKADPESKGKVENVVQYVKKNFLYNRHYSDLETLNNETIAWLARTANYLPHNSTKKSPATEFEIEKKHLAPYVPMALQNKEKKKYTLRKDNTINYKSNFYTVPQGTYSAINTDVLVVEKDGCIEVYSIKNELITTHKISSLKGKIISNTNHRRDTSKSLDDMIQKTANSFTDSELAVKYILKIKNKVPRYTRDHLQVILKTLSNINKETADKTLKFCVENNILNAYDWEHVAHVFVEKKESNKTIETPDIKPLNAIANKKINESPQLSNINDYEDIINN
ncbi:MAG: IS21 family transposase [Bacteroidales bacterium]|nr:IS21 family transposase [Bacteroidales bacterium]